MTLADLPRLLKLGLGRAIPLIRQHYDPSYRDVILKACINLLAMDGQIEGTRSEYMFEVIEATGDLKFYRDAILDAAARLDNTVRDYDIQQTLLMVSQFAERGDAEARQMLVDRFLAEPQFCDFITAHTLILLDGFDGFVFVAEHLSTLIRQYGEDFSSGNQTYTPDIRLFFSLQSAVGADLVEAIWEQFESNNPTLKPVFDLIDLWRDSPVERSKRKEREQLSYDEFRQQLQEMKSQPGFYECRLWGRGATDDELRRAAEDFLLETNPQQLRRYLGIFQDRPFPLDLTKLILLASGGTEFIKAEEFDAAQEIRRPSLVIGSINTLSVIASLRVRDFALESIGRGYETGRMTGLLVSNYQSGDWARVEPLTLRTLDDEDYHSLGFSLFDLFDAHRSLEAIPAFLNLYEHDPCGPCRERIVARLHWLGALPDWMRQECLLDSYESLRESVASDFADYRD